MSNIPQGNLTYFQCYNNNISTITNINALATNASQVYLYNNKLPLSTLFDISQRVTSAANNKQFGVQRLEQAAIIDVPVDWSPLPAQNVFNGNYTTYDRVFIGNTTTGTEITGNSSYYTVFNGDITFHQLGTYTAIMKNTGIVCNTTTPAAQPTLNIAAGLQVITTFSVCELITGITGVPSTVTVGNNVNLGGAAVQPSTATNNTIAWSLEDADGTGASLSGSTLSGIINTGTITVKATVTNGLGCTDYEKLFYIEIEEEPEPAVCGSVGTHFISPVTSGTETKTEDGLQTYPFSNFKSTDDKLVAWVVYNIRCGVLDIRVYDKNDNNKRVDKEYLFSNYEKGVCGDSLRIDLDVISGNPDLDFEFYMEAGTCLGSVSGVSPMPSGVNDFGISDGSSFSGSNKNKTKGEIGSPVVFTYGVDRISILPISLVDFNAHCRNGQVLLNWRTATETNNNYFTIERGAATNNNSKVIKRSKVAEVKGAGNSNMPLNYSYTDNVTTGDNVYYRLKQTDFNGKFEYFNPIVVSCPQSPHDISIYPNPTNGIINIRTNSGVMPELKLYSLDGRLLLQTYGNELDLSGYAKGMYLLYVNGNTFKIVKE